MIDMKNFLIEKLNSFYWRHVTSQDPEAYKKEANLLRQPFDKLNLWPSK